MNYNEFECPNCEGIVEVPIPYATYVVCAECGLRLEVHPDAEFDGLWHDRTTLSVASDSGAIVEAAQG